MRDELPTHSAGRRAQSTPTRSAGRSDTRSLQHVRVAHDHADIGSRAREPAVDCEPEPIRRLPPGTVGPPDPDPQQICASPESLADRHLERSHATTRHPKLGLDRAPIEPHAKSTEPITSSHPHADGIAPQPLTWTWAEHQGGRT